MACGLQQCISQVVANTAVAPFGRGTAAAVALSCLVLASMTAARLRLASKLLRDWTELQQIASSPAELVRVSAACCRERRLSGLSVREE